MYALKDQGLPDAALVDPIKHSCCSTQVSENATCTWDSDAGVLTTQRETSKNETLVESDEATWFKDAFEDLRLAKKGGHKKPTPLW